MEHVSSFEAKTHLSKLLSAVALKGKEYVITKHNRAVARLVPYIDKKDKIENVITNIKNNRLKIDFSTSDIQLYKAVGRR